jgi:hypothetical protein
MPGKPAGGRRLTPLRDEVAGATTVNVNDAGALAGFSTSANGNTNGMPASP